MIENEEITLILSLLAICVSFVSLVRTRKYSEIQSELNKIDTKLSKKQLNKIIDNEIIEDQPAFSIRVVRVSGAGEFGTSEYKAYVRVKVGHTGCEYLHPKSITLIMLKDGLFKRCPGAAFEFLGVNEQEDPILGERKIIINPDSKLHLGKVHICYIDNKGLERTQEFGIFPEGPKGPLPLSVIFKLEKIYTRQPGELWSI